MRSALLIVFGFLRTCVPQLPPQRSELQFQPPSATVTLSTTHPIGAPLLITPRLHVETAAQNHGGISLALNSPFQGAFAVEPDHLVDSSDFDIVLTDPTIFGQLEFDKDRAKEFSITVIAIMNGSESAISEQMTLSIRVIDDFKPESLERKRIFAQDFQEVTISHPFTEAVEELTVVRLAEPYQPATLSFNLVGDFKELFSAQHQSPTAAIIRKRSCQQCQLNETVRLVVEVMEVNTGLTDELLLVIRPGANRPENPQNNFNPSSYHSSITEKSSELRPPVVLQFDPQLKMRLSIDQISLVDAFGIDDSGLLYVINPELISNEHLGSKLSFNAIGTDQFNRTATASITIVIDKIVASPTVSFKQDVYKFSIPDHVDQEESLVGRVDISFPRSSVRYTLLAGGDGCFRVNPTNGSIVRKCLQLKQGSPVNLTISAISDPPVMGDIVATCEIHIAIETMGSIPPTIVSPSETNFVITVDEGRNFTSPLLAIAVNDTDALDLVYEVTQVVLFDSNGLPVNKDLKDFEFAPALDVCSHYGEMCSTLDVSKLTVREMFLRQSLKSMNLWAVHVTIQVRDVSHPVEPTASILLIIHIRRQYSVTPVIVGSLEPGDTPHFQINLAEDLMVGSSVFQLTAFSDAPDYGWGCSRQTNNFTVSGMGREFFSIDTLTGLMSLRKPFTKTGVFNLIGSVVNCNHMATTLLTVTVTPDPNRPISFNRTSYSVEMSDGVPVGAEVLQVTLVDHSDMMNVNFSLLGEYANLFHIDTQGIIRTAIANMTLSRVSLFVKARKSLTTPGSYTEAMVPVYINVTRSHRQPPTFRFYHHSNGYEVEVMENTPVGGYILQIESNTPVDEADRNSVAYRLFDLTPELESALKTDRKTGLITVKGSLHGMVGSYQLAVEVADQYGMTSVAQLQLTVLSSTQCLPRFISPTSEGTIVELDQDSPIDTLVTTFHAETSMSCPLRYQFFVADSHQYTAELPLFHLDEITGDLKTTGKFTQQPEKKFRLRVAALDTSSNGSLNTDTEVMVILTNRMDKEPIFVADGCSATEDYCDPTSEVILNMAVNHDVPDGHLIGSVQANVKRHADADGHVYFYIVDSNSPSIVVGQKTGEIRTSGHLRDDSHNPIELKLLVATKDRLDHEELMQLDRFPQKAVVLVRIEIAGVSSSAPIFHSKLITSVCPAEAIWGHKVAQVAAVSPLSSSSEPSEAIFYRLNRLEFFYKRVMSEQSDQLKVDVNSGEVVVNTNMRDFSNGVFNVTVEASNEPTFTMNDSSTMELEVWLYEQKHLVRLLVTVSPDEILSELPQLLRMINTSLGYEAQFVRAEYHFISTYNFSSDLSELLVVMVDREGKRLLERSEVDRLVEMHRRDGLQLPSMFDRIGGFQPFEMDSLLQWNRTGPIAALAVLICILVGGCIAFAAVVYRNRQRLLKELEDIRNGKDDRKKSNSDVMTISTVTDNPIWTDCGEHMEKSAVSPISTLTDGTAVVRVKGHYYGDSASSEASEDPLYETLSHSK